MIIGFGEYTPWVSMPKNKRAGNVCRVCKEIVPVGEPIYWDRQSTIMHQDCYLGQEKFESMMKGTLKDLLADPQKANQDLINIMPQCFRRIVIYESISTLLKQVKYRAAIEAGESALNHFNEDDDVIFNMQLAIAKAKLKITSDAQKHLNIALKSLHSNKWNLDKDDTRFFMITDMLYTITQNFDDSDVVSLADFLIKVEKNNFMALICKAAASDEKESMKIYNEMLSAEEYSKKYKYNHLTRFMVVRQKLRILTLNNCSSNIALEKVKKYHSPNDPELLVWYIENFYASREESATKTNLGTFFKKRPTSNQRKEIIEKYNGINAFDDYQLKIMVGEQKSKTSVSKFLTSINSKADRIKEFEEFSEKRAAKRIKRLEAKIDWTDLPNRYFFLLATHMMGWHKKDEDIKDIFQALMVRYLTMFGPSTYDKIFGIERGDLPMSDAESDMYGLYLLPMHISSILGPGEETDPKTPLGMKFCDEIVDSGENVDLLDSDFLLPTRIRLIPTEAAKKKYCQKILEKYPHNKFAQKIVGIKPRHRLTPDEKELVDIPKSKDVSDKLENDEDTHTEYKEKYFLTEEDKRSIREENSKASDRDQKIAITENEKGVQLGISKGICAFLDTEGGTLSIGVHDDGRVLGIERDFDVLKKSSKPGRCESEIQLKDEMKNRITTNVKNHLDETPPILFSNLIRYEWLNKQTKSGKKLILQIKVEEISKREHYWPLTINGAAYQREGARNEPKEGRALIELVDWGRSQKKK